MSVAPVQVMLEPWQVDWGAYAAKQRTARNDGKVKNKPDYTNSAVLQTDIEANTASCLCELALSLFTKQSWNGPYWYPEYHSAASRAPDVGLLFEMRRTRNLGSGIPVFEREAKLGRILVQGYIAPEHLQAVLDSDPKYVRTPVLLTGFVSARIAWQYGYQKYPEKRVCNSTLFQSVLHLSPEFQGNMFESASHLGETIHVSVA